ncbi:hypothetical protein [Brevibacillus sp. H7]|uniref:hypothetical protein n=1 Tax=Brevibacillus sp. H7 TaxID=3349138 RepID=UPI003814A5C2
MITGVLRVLVVCLLWISLAGYGHAQAETETGKRQAIVIFIEGLSFRDFVKLKTYPHVDKWLKNGQIGALTARTPGPRTSANGYLLLGTGGQALYTERSGTAYHPEEHLSSVETAGERAAQLRVSQTDDVARSRIVFPGIFRLHAENVDKPYTARIGLLGETLAMNGIPVASYGNGDFDDVKQRHGVLFSMNERGTVPHGDLSARTLMVSPAYPYGVRTDYAYLEEQLRHDRTSGLITVQLSDLARLYQLSDYMEPARFELQYERVLADLDGFIGQVLEKRKPGQMVLLLSPAVNQRAQQEKSLLAPILLWRGESSGHLVSATTRQTGLVSGLDVLPTILSWLSVPLPSDLVGHVMRSETGKTADDLVADVWQIDHLYRNRPSVLYTYVMLQIVVLVAASLLWLWGKGKSGEHIARARRGVRLALLSMLCFPALFLLEAWFGWMAAPPVVLGALILMALGGAMLAEGRPLPLLLMVMAGATAGGLLLDGFTGATAMRRSYLGYDPVVGARFYGLGNEYEGVLIGSVILFVSALYEWSSRRQDPSFERRMVTASISVLVFVTVLYYMAAPALGTNAGGFLAGLAGFSVALARLQGWQAGKKGLLLLAGGLCGGIVILIVSSLVSGQPLTHVGRVAQEIVSGNWMEVTHIVERKLEMNLKLIRVSAWSKVFAISLVVLSLLSLRSDRYLQHLAAHYPYLAKGFLGVIAGSVAGLALNDSGIVTAATAIIYLVVPALYTALGEKEDQRYST